MLIATWLTNDLRVGLVLLGVGAVVVVMAGGLLCAISRWGE